MARKPGIEFEGAASDLHIPAGLWKKQEKVDFGV
jgi:hypothetical protein